MLRLAVLCCFGLGLGASEVGAAEETCSAGGGPGCGAPSPAPFCPYKGHNLNHSGLSHSVGPFDISKPLWIWEEPNRKNKGNEFAEYMKVFHASPMLDGEYNTYIQSTTGYVYSIDKAGKTRWEFKTSRSSPANIAILGDVVYTIDDAGVVFAIDKNSGKELVRNKVALSAPSDTHSLVARDGLVLTACNPKNHDLGWGRGAGMMGEAVCALDAKDLQVRWIFDHIEYTKPRMDALSCNQLQAIVGDTAIFGDSFGGVYRVALEDGAVRWYATPITDMGRIAATKGMLPYGTTGTVVVGPNDRVYHAFNTAGQVGTVRAFNVHNGRAVWERSFPGTEANAAVAVGKVYGWGERLAVVIALGSNPEMTMSWWHWIRSLLGLVTVSSPVMALRADSGATLWKLDLSHNGHCSGSHVSLDREGTLCAPDIWGNPTIGADGTVYLNWSGGKTFAVRDANGDGVVDPKDPKEVSSYSHGFGSNGATAVAPGYAVAPSCRQIMAFSS